ncbi:hypothetical protein RFF05_01740 [Bengtsoniella intestinalis]|uniref:hypothetical protein n=1 Tax=Bengtsoniella intestinalis TaxID=3073143 RepID=UPI00391FAD98
MLDYETMCQQQFEIQKTAISILQQKSKVAKYDKSTSYIYKMLYFNQLEANQRAIRILNASLEAFKTT